MAAASEFSGISSDCSTLHIPTTEDDISANWFSSVTGIPIPDTKSFEILRNPNSAVGNLSKIVRVGLTGPSESTRRSFMIKLLPVPKSAFEVNLLKIITSENMDGREVFFYAALKCELQRLVPEIAEFLVPCHQSAKVDSRSLIILEDMSPQGYSMPSFADGLSPEHFNEALRFAAIFHFAGEMLQLHRGGGSLASLFPELNTWHVPRSSTASLFTKFQSLTWFGEGLEFLAENILPPEMVPAYRALRPHTEQIIRRIAEIGAESATIVHDDLWPHNFLCHPNGKIKVIDWQLLGYTDPTYELCFFLLTCLPIDDLTAFAIAANAALKTYYRTKEALYAEQGLRMTRSLEQFLDFYRKYGLCYGFLCLTMSADSIYAEAAFRPKLAKILEYFWEAQVPQSLLANLIY